MNCHSRYFASLLVPMLFALPVIAAESESSRPNTDITRGGMPDASVPPATSAPSKTGTSLDASPQFASTHPTDASARWQFAITPYLWLPSVGGTLRFSLPAGGATASTGPYNYLEHLRFALMLQGEARKGDWSLLADFIYLNFGRHNSSISTPDGVQTQQDVKTSLSGVLVQLGGGRTVARWPWGSADSIVGMRYLGVNSTLNASLSASADSGQNLTTGIHASQSVNVFNGFAGVRGRLSLADDGRWFVPYYLDVGAGTARFTWQAMSGIGYAAAWGDASLTYRYLAFYGSGDQFVQSLRFHGPSANITVRF